MAAFETTRPAPFGAISTFHFVQRMSDLLATVVAWNDARATRARCRSSAIASSTTSVSAAAISMTSARSAAEGPQRTGRSLPDHLPKAAPHRDAAFSFA